MRNTIKFLLSHYLFWLLFFIVFRLFFLASLYPFAFDAGVSEMLLALIAGIQLDISTTSYLLLFPFLLLVLLFAGFDRAALYITRCYYAVIIFVMVLIGVANITIYKYWGTLLNNRALAYLAQPKEALASVTNMQLFLMIIVILLLVFTALKLHTTFVLNYFKKINPKPLAGAILWLLFLPVLVIGIRGGLQLIPVNESSAVYSHHHALNQVAINPAWFLGHNLHQAGLSEKNPYAFMDDARAYAITQSTLKKSSDDSLSIFNLTGKPNIVIILLESWTADVIEPLDGVKGVTPFFSQLSESGLLFSSVYSSGFRTDQALISVLSGFPSQPNKSIIRFPAKAAALPSLGREFKNAGYKNSFYYGGELGFANMNNYLLNSGFERIISIDDFSSNKMNSKWGAHDQFVLSKQLDDLEQEKQPFLSTLLTLSTHEPFEVPIKTPFNDKSESEQFKKSAWYTDNCLGEYFRKAKNTSWYNNTIFILMADHGHRLPLSREYLDPRLRQIPLLIVSPLLKDEFKGQKVNTIANQHDVAATLLRNLGMNDEAFTWSVNIMDKQRTSFAYLSLDIAFTWKDEKQTLIIPLQPGMENFGGNAEQIITAKAYVQHLYHSFTTY